MENQFYTQPQDKTYHYGGFWIRLVAYFIDGILNNIISFILSIILGVAYGMTSGATSLDMTPDTIFKLRIMSFVLSIFTTWFYFALFNSSKYMATPGKMLLGLIVVDKEYKRLSFAKATGRFFATFVSSIILFIGFFMAGFTNKKRALHDMMAGTYVIYK